MYRTSRGCSVFFGRGREPDIFGSRFIRRVSFVLQWNIQKDLESLDSPIQTDGRDQDNINLGQLQVILVLSGLLSLLASISCTLFLSAKCKDSLSALLISLAVMLLPTIVYTALGSSVWVSTILPSAGIGLQNNFLYQLYGFNFLYIGDMSFWTPYIILISAALEIPVFLCLAIRAYCKHRVA